MGFFSSLFGPKTDYRQLIKDGAKAIDVRTPGEFKSGHAKNSKNMPLQDIEKWKTKFKEGDEVVLVCKSGVRASMAKRVLKAQGVTVHNAGAWTAIA